MGKNRKNGQGDEGDAPGWAGARTVALDRMIGRLEDKFQKEDFKASVGDYIRLVQARKDLGDEQPTEVIVSWLEPSEKEPARV